MRGERPSPKKVKPGSRSKTLELYSVWAVAETPSVICASAGSGVSTRLAPARLIHSRNRFTSETSVTRLIGRLRRPRQLEDGWLAHYRGGSKRRRIARPPTRL